MLHLLARPIVWAIGGGAAAYVLYKKNQDTGEKLKQTRLELIEQQRTIDRLRAEVGRERNLRKQDG
jgi:hypothetical protein